MPEFVIERDTPDAGKLNAKELKDAAQTSCDVLRELGPEIQWVNTYLSDDKMYCVFRASSESLVYEHAQRAGVPINRLSRVRTVMNPTTAE